MTTRTKRPFRILAAALIIAAIPLALPAEVKLPAVIGILVGIVLTVMG